MSSWYPGWLNFSSKSEDFWSCLCRCTGMCRSALADRWRCVTPMGHASEEAVCPTSSFFVEKALWRTTPGVRGATSGNSEVMFKKNLGPWGQSCSIAGKATLHNAGIPYRCRWDSWLLPFPSSSLLTHLESLEDNPSSWAPVPVWETLKNSWLLVIREMSQQLEDRSFSLCVSATLTFK